jgi:hypothetical protein
MTFRTNENNTKKHPSAKRDHWMCDLVTYFLEKLIVV